MSKIHKHSAIDEKELILSNFSEEELSNEVNMNFSDFMSSRKGKIQETFGVLWLVKKSGEGYTKLINLDGQQHGYDGILFKNGKFYIYESKLSKQHTLKELIKSAQSTIIMPMSTRIPNLEWAKNNIELIETKQKTSLKSEIELLDKLILSIKNKCKPEIENNRSIICLGKKVGTQSKFDKMIEDSKGELELFERAVVIKYDK